MYVCTCLFVARTVACLRSPSLRAGEIKKEFAFKNRHKGRREREMGEGGREGDTDGGRVRKLGGTQGKSQYSFERRKSTLVFVLFKD